MTRTLDPERSRPMSNWNELEQTLTRHLNLDRAPVAITFCGAAPAGVRKFDASVPSGCTFTARSRAKTRLWSYSSPS